MSEPETGDTIRYGSSRMAAMDNGLRPTGSSRRLHISLQGEEALVKAPRVEPPCSTDMEADGMSKNGIGFSDTVGDQDGRFCFRTFWAYPNSGIMAINARAYINGEIADPSALACWATWRDRLIQTLFYQAKYLFRNRLSLQSTTKLEVITRVQNGRKQGQVGGWTDDLSTTSGYSTSHLSRIGQGSPDVDRFVGNEWVTTIGRWLGQLTVVINLQDSTRLNGRSIDTHTDRSGGGR